MAAYCTARFLLRRRKSNSLHKVSKETKQTGNPLPFFTMSMQDDTQSVSSLTRLDAGKLSYSEMTVDPSGGVMSREVKLEWRQKLGYCTTCDERPVLLFTFKRSRMNPLWKTKEARSVPGECENGVCLRCQKEREQLEQQRRETAARISAPATNNSAWTGTRQVSNSTLGSTFNNDYTSRSNSADSTRFASLHHHHASHPSRIGRNAGRETPSKPRLRSMSHEDMLLTSTNHAGSFLSTNGNGQRSVSRHLSGNQRQAARSDHRAAILPRGGHEQNATPHLHPSTIDEMNQSMSEMLPVPTLISPQKRPMNSRQMSTTELSVASSLSCEFSVRSLGEESMSSLNNNTSAEGHRAASETVTVVSDTSAENNIKDQLRGLLADMRSNPVMTADVLLHAMKSNADKDSIQMFCLENIHLPPQAVSDTVSNRNIRIPHHRSQSVISQFFNRRITGRVSRCLASHEEPSSKPQDPRSRPGTPPPVVRRRRTTGPHGQPRSL